MPPGKQNKRKFREKKWLKSLTEAWWRCWRDEGGKKNKSGIKKVATLISQWSFPWRLWPFRPTRVTDCNGDYLHIWSTKKSLCPRLLQSTVFKMDDTKKNLAQTVGGSTEAAEKGPPRGRRVSQWEGPNEEFLQMLMNLGISKNAAVKVLWKLLKICSRVMSRFAPPRGKHYFRLDVVFY